MRTKDDPQRVGARRIADVSAEIKAGIESGELDTQNHIEQMAVDQRILFATMFPDYRSEAERLTGLGFIAQLREAGKVLFEHQGEQAYASRPLHARDLVRGWCGFAIDADPEISVPSAIEAATYFADDRHFAVREWAWLAVRRRIASDPLSAIESIEARTQSPTSRITRFYVEATRPRSVWGVHIKDMKAHPEMAENLLLSAAQDRDPYVQTSIANWVRDASRTRGDWALEMVATLEADPNVSVLLARRFRQLRLEISRS